MKRIVHYSGLTIIIVAFFSCKPKVVVECGDIPYMPMQAIHENSLEYLWQQKTVLESKLLSDMETMGSWEHRGRFGSLVLSDEKPYKDKHSLLLESPTRDTVPVPRSGRSWGSATAFFKVDNEDWTGYNRITFWIYPDMPGWKVIPISLSFHNDGEEKVPWAYAPIGSSQPVVENQKWNKVYWEIPNLGRDKVIGFSINYVVRGHERGASGTARLFIDDLYLEKVEVDHFEGWDVAPNEIAYNHAGYTKGHPKVAFTSESIGQKFVLKDLTSSKVVKEGIVSSRTTPTGSFQMMDFSEVNTEGTYILEVGRLKTKPFAIGTFSDVFRSSIIKTVNHFYAQRCGFAIPGIHDACHLDWMCEHEGKSVPIHGGWHDAGDLSQGLVNTAEAAYAMMMLAEKLKKADPALSDRLMEEAEWGVAWMLQTRFDNGYRNVWCTKDGWTDGIIGTNDDFNSTARKDPHANLLSTTTEAFASMALKERNPFLAARALKCAIEDYGFGIEIEPQRMSVELAGAALNAALALFEITKDEIYKKKAIEHAGYILSCQQQDESSAIPLRGFFYNTSAKETILHYGHRGHEQDVVVGLVKLSQLFPSESAEWKKALRLYADYYKTICAYTAPYYMIPAGIYDVTKARTEEDAEQIRNGVKLNDRYFMKRFPVWKEYRGNSGTTLTQAKGLAVVANFLQDKDLSNIAYRAFDWHLGINPFTQSLMYGEGYRFAPQFTYSSGNLVGGLTVGVQTHFFGDEPYWPAEICWTWKEIWVHPSTRWLMLVCDFI
jgi:hypothetical protein